MKLTKKVLALLISATIGFAVVGCSNEESEPVEGGEGTRVEENADKGNEETTQKEVVLVDDEIVKIAVTEKFNDEIFGPSYKFVIENKSDKKITVQSRDTSIDGVMSEPVFSVDVTPGKTAKDSMTFMDIETLDELKNLEGKLIVMDENYDDLGSYDITIE